MRSPWLRTRLSVRLGWDFGGSCRAGLGPGWCRVGSGLFGVALGGGCVGLGFVADVGLFYFSLVMPEMLLVTSREWKP